MLQKHFRTDTGVGRGAGRILYEFIQTNLDSQLVQSLPLYNLGTGICQKTFPFSFKTLVYNISHDGVKDGVTEKFQSLIIQRTSFFRADRS